MKDAYKISLIGSAMFTFGFVLSLYKINIGIAIAFAGWLLVLVAEMYNFNLKKAKKWKRQILRK